MEKYDGWVIKNKWGSLLFFYLEKTRAEVIRGIECRFDDHWENIKKRHEFKLVKIKLVEVSDG